MNGFKETEIGSIPEEWQLIKFEDVCIRITENYQPKINGTLPYIGLEHIESGKATIKSYGKESDIKSSKSKFQKGQIRFHL